jgi:hypothetical protein
MKLVKWLVVLGTLALPACTSEDSESRTLLVPQDYTTIQSAVDEARTGDLILISPGTYSESVRIVQDNLVIRGLERNTVVIDGGDELSNGFEVSGNSVAIENLTVKSFRQNGIIFSGALRGPVSNEGIYGTDDNTLDGYRVSYVTSFNNGLYGVYAFASKNGIIEHSYVSGHPDSGIYVGQCRPCNVVIRSTTAENNAIGYYGTNASSNVWVVESVFRENRLGITPNSQKAEMLSPQRGATIAANLVEDNDNPNAPEIPQGFFGGGIVIGGGTANLVARNVVRGHAWAGIVIMPLNDLIPMDNEIHGNVSQANGTDLLFVGRPEDSLKNCFSENVFVTSTPADIEQKMSCVSEATLRNPTTYSQPNGPPGPSYRDVAPPSKQVSMPNAATASLGLPINEPLYPILEDLVVPIGQSS